MPEKRIGEILVENSRLTQEQFATALEVQQQTPNIPIGQIICQLGYLSAEDMSLALDISKKRLNLGDILVKQNLIDQEKLENAINLSKKDNISLGSALVKQHIIKEEQLARAISSQYDLPYVSLDKYILPEELGKYFSASYAMKHRIVAIQKCPCSVTVAMAFPLSPHVLHELEELIHLTIKPVIARESDIFMALENIYGVQRKAPTASQVDPVQLDIMEDFSSEELRSKYVLDHNVDYIAKRLISVGVQINASDIHLEFTESGADVRFRIDGVLQSIDMGGDYRLIMTHGRPLISKIKILCDMDITEKRRPQNGSFRVKMTAGNFPKTVDFRVSTVPTKYGENMVIRILDRKGPMSLQTLGFSNTVSIELDRLLAKPTGIFLVTGPTGSGKSSTLYSILGRLNSPGVKTMTVEDPIEYTMDGISQSEVNTAIGNTFAEYLRAFLRQDPDNIMVGEIRDVETAMISIRASLTGHTVLSTLHTNDSTGVVPRLLDMGVDATLLSSTLHCVISQRLVRINCTHCREEYQPNAEILEEFGVALGSTSLFIHGKGCPNCNCTGFSGRLPIVEMWIPSREEALLINKHAENQLLRESAFINGNNLTMLQDGLERVLKGETTLEELVRVIPYEQVLEYRRKIDMGLGKRL
ncbi:MAG: type II/IV secretion system protein [Geobacteraceae bacterium]|nr:type II/IV secretion system protein [Geobacteraceae bacterium]